jgi:hypothetical protein
VWVWLCKQGTKEEAKEEQAFAERCLDMHEVREVMHEVMARGVVTVPPHTATHPLQNVTPPPQTHAALLPPQSVSPPHTLVLTAS